ncbi:hypothetical protein CC1G_01003 [Coprinopsis cinerea okayama7|uniref:RBR-type E3 ubiquitin transferase n=1 Tax=Coprinopsis cinerea (strain Okayama-7 / 130 / ATCC MYA-4618 / FGSC 9003) TaxID=240176 RepID=A8N9C8_COPC7|nr:hypothetical protein CC1G_01003 [Coprinopsis cinerea okayama7\|eukprot:XP_001831456.2 hypothetical protein CC1G_01003 [Coprinopsis cinerea okayama7\
MASDDGSDDFEVLGMDDSPQEAPSVSARNDVQQVRPASPLSPALSDLSDLVDEDDFGVIEMASDTQQGSDDASLDAPAALATSGGESPASHSSKADSSTGVVRGLESVDQVCQPMCPLHALLVTQQVLAVRENNKLAPVDTQEQRIRSFLKKEKNFEPLLSLGRTIVPECGHPISEHVDRPLFKTNLKFPIGLTREESVIKGEVNVERISTVLSDNLVGEYAAVFSFTPKLREDSLHATVALVCIKISSAGDEEPSYRYIFLHRGLGSEHEADIEAVTKASTPDGAQFVAELLRQNDSTAFEAHLFGITGPTSTLNAGTPSASLASQPMEEGSDAKPLSFSQEPPPYSEFANSPTTTQGAVTSDDGTGPPPPIYDQVEEPPQPKRRGTVRTPRGPRKSSGQDLSWMLSLQSQPLILSSPPPPPPAAEPEAQTSTSSKANEDGSDARVQVFSEDKLQLLFGPPKGTQRDDNASVVQAKDKGKGKEKEVEELNTSTDSNRSATSRKKYGDFQWQRDLIALSIKPGWEVKPDSPAQQARSRQPRASSSSRPVRKAEAWSPLMLRPELMESATKTPTTPMIDERDDAGSSTSTKGKGKENETTVPSRSSSRAQGDDVASPRASLYRAVRNDFAWQLALASTTLKPSEDYMREREERKKKIQMELGLVPFDCLVCFETIEWEDGARMTGCEHSFCKDCISGHIQSKLDENLFPVVCPVCLADQDRQAKGTVEEPLVLDLDLDEKYQDRFIDLQLAQLSIQIDCPGCKQSMMIAREDYLAEPFIVCPLQFCHARFCRACRVTVYGDTADHACKIDEALDKLMQENGWRYCPGCKTPIQKASGCNHMTCGTPGCSVHFCYTCGESIWDTNSPDSLATCLSQHYSNCAQFDPEPREVPAEVNAAGGAAHRRRRLQAGDRDCLIQ